MAKRIKVYEVKTGFLEAKDDIQNFGTITITGKDVFEIISKIEKNYNLEDNEYILSMNVVATLD